MNLRVKYALAHLVVSLIIVFLVAMFLMWDYGSSAYFFAGALPGLKLVFIVDVVVGPLLTFVVVNKAKKSLHFDLGLIACMQLAALMYGSFTVFKMSPCVQVVSYDGVYVFSRSESVEYKIRGLNDAMLSCWGPINVFQLDLPESSEKLKVVKSVTELVEGKPLAARSDLYLPLTPIASYLSQFKRDVTDSCLIMPLFGMVVDKHICYEPTLGAVTLISKAKVH